MADKYQTRFLELRNKIHDSKNGYFKEFISNGKTYKVPYHSVETFMCEAPDYGHETTSEAYSYYMWLEAMYGKFTKDWSTFTAAWDSADMYIIPHGLDQAGMGTYNPSKPATLANEWKTADKYPSKLETTIPVGSDPISGELKSAYGSDEMYGMHWLLDVDNWYGFGNRGDGTNNAPSYINTFERGEQESVFETVPHPSYETFKWGGKSGYLDLFTGDSTYSKQWRYTNAPDADSRAIQATYWASAWAKEQGADISQYVGKASKMGDYLRYSMFDKYFKKIGCQDKNAGGTGTESQHYLLSWYYAWGAGADGNWSWKIGCSHNHFGYQNPLAAWVLSNTTDFKPKSSTGASDWAKSLTRQLEFYQWLQSSEGAIAGGATNSYTTDTGSYSKYPAGAATFYNMVYDWQPIYHDPPSNEWFGMQVWSMQRVAQYFYETGDTKAQTLLEKWVKWVKSEVTLNADGTFQIPGTLAWSGQPDTWTGISTGNPNLHVSVVTYSHDLGPAAGLADTLIHYSAATKKYSTYDDDARKLAQELLDRMWNLYCDDKGLSIAEPRGDYKRIFEQEVYIPQGWSGIMANGDAIKPGVKFIDIRSKYKQDPDFQRVQDAYNKKEDPIFNYHRFWAQASIALANGAYSIFFGGDIPPVLTGDVNNDGLVNSTDSALLQRYVLGRTTDINVTNADMNADGVINSTDLALLKRKILGR